MHKRIRRIAVVASVLLAGVAGSIYAATPAEAKTNTVILSGASWLGGGGVDVYSNDGSYGSADGDYNSITIGARTYRTGLRWQCVELILRLYYAQGWIALPSNTTSFGWNAPTGAYQMYDSAPSNLAKQANGSIDSVGPGDVIVLGGGLGGLGHVAVVDSVTGSGTSRTVATVSQNISSTNARANFTWDTAAKTISSGWSGYTTTGIVHAPGTASGSSGSPTDNGKFVSYHNAVYRIAGGAPLYVSSSDAGYSDLSGWASATLIDDGQWASLRPFPADGTYLSDVATGRVYITAGGAPMYISPSDASFLPNWTNAEKVPHWDFANWQHLRQFAADGYFLKDVQTNMVYETAGGVPFYVSSSDAALLPQWQYATPVPHYEFTIVDHFRLHAADNTYITDVQTGRTYVIAGGAPLYVSGDDAPLLPQWAGALLGPHWEFVNYQRLRQYPGSGTLVTNVRNGGVYDIIGGAPLYVSSSDAAYFPGWSTAIRVPGWDFSAYEHLRQYPDDGWMIADVQTGQVYITAGGAPLYVSSSDAQYFPNLSWALRVPHWDFQNWSHLRQYPADNTYLMDVTTGRVYLTAGGSPMYISPGGGPYFPNWPNAVHVPGWDFVNHADLRQKPADGTYVQGVPSGEVFQMVGGAAVRVTSNPLPAAIAVDDWAIVNQLGGTL